MVKKSKVQGRLASPGALQCRRAGRIHSVGGFRNILSNEQDRAGRSQEEFSLVVFSMNGTGPGSTQFGHLAEAVIGRIRSTDEVGWLDNQRLGVVLPYTSAAGARRLAADVCRACSATGVVPDQTIYAYPSKWFSNDSGTRHQSRSGDISPGSGAADTPDGYASGKDISGRALDLTACSHSMQTRLNHWTQARTRRLFCKRRLPVWKRAMDIVVASAGLVLLSPLIILISLIIKSMSPGPVFFKQKRAGYMGKPFTMWKFRTMKVNSDPSDHKQYVTKLINGAAENGEAFGKPMTKLDDDPRIIPFGKVLRKTCLDELPQLVNVLLGKMTLVGPRPGIDYEVEVYSTWHYRRLHAVPGVTGLWQVNGKNRLTFNQMVRLDIKYLRERSFWLDVSILLKTPFAVLSQVRDRLQEKEPAAELIVENA